MGQLKDSDYHSQGLIELLKIHQILQSDFLLFNVKPQNKRAYQGLYHEHQPRHQAMERCNNEIDRYKNPYHRINDLQRIQNIADGFYFAEFLFHCVKLVVGLCVEETGVCI